MPELPDVEAARRLVEDAATGALIHTVACPDPSALRNTTLRRFRHSVIGRHVRSTARRGKWLTIGTDGVSVLVHLGMTGALRWEVGGDGAEPQLETDDDRFCRLALVTDRGALCFIDRRARPPLRRAPRHPRRVEEAAQGGPHGPVAAGGPREHAQRRDPVAGPTPPDPSRLHPRCCRGEAVVRRREGHPGGIGPCRAHPSHALVALRSAGGRRSHLSSMPQGSPMVHRQRPIGPVVPALPAPAGTVMNRARSADRGRRRG